MDVDLENQRFHYTGSQEMVKSNNKTYAL